MSSFPLRVWSFYEKKIKSLKSKQHLQREKKEKEDREKEKEDREKERKRK